MEDGALLKKIDRKVEHIFGGSFAITGNLMAAAYRLFNEGSLQTSLEIWDLASGEKLLGPLKGEQVTEGSGGNYVNLTLDSQGDSNLIMYDENLGQTVKIWSTGAQQENTQIAQMPNNESGTVEN